MKTYISILRGINVAGHNQIKMDALRQLYVDLGYAEIKTYIQSGNVIFKSESTATKTLEKTIGGKIYSAFGLKVPVIILTFDELKNALEHNPFMNESSKNPTFMHLTFLSDIPELKLLDNIQSDYFLPDEFHWSGKTIYLYCPVGYGNTKLNNTFFENKLKVSATTRNLRTCKELLSLAEK